MILAKNYLERLPKSQLLDLAEFVVTENFKHHTNASMPENYKEDVHSIYQEELNYYENSEVFTTKDSSGAILGSIRVLKWNYTDILPLQKIFGINPLLAISTPDVNNIYHIGRFAIKKNVRDLNLFKGLLACVSQLICNHRHNIAFAECDSKLLRILKLLGVKATIVGESVTYLGSETIPVSLSYDGVINFYNENKHLINNILKKSNDAYRLPKSVAFNSLEHNYSLV
jgi:hypothetical protein